MSGGKRYTLSEYLEEQRKRKNKNNTSTTDYAKYQEKMKTYKKEKDKKPFEDIDRGLWKRRYITPEAHIERKGDSDEESEKQKNIAQQELLNRYKKIEENKKIHEKKDTKHNIASNEWSKGQNISKETREFLNDS